MLGTLYGGYYYGGGAGLALPNPLAISLAGRIAITSRSGAFHVGDLWIPTATVTSPETDAVVEPGGITFTFLSYRGAGIAGSAWRTSTGVWRSSIELTEAGFWKVSVETTAPYKASRPAQIPVKPAFDE